MNPGLSRHMESEPHGTDIAQRLNWLRAGVLGANDGIVSVASIVVGVAGATSQTGPVWPRGLPGWWAGRYPWHSVSTSP